MISGRDPFSGQPIAVRIEAGRIAGIEPGAPDETAWLAPGLIDLQVNGTLGIDLNLPALHPTEVTGLALKLATLGVTCFAPTLITASEAQITGALRAIAQARRDPFIAHMIPFVHVEGPSISPEDGPRGAHPLAHVRPPDLAEFERWQAASAGLVGLVTLSPHWPDIAAYIAALHQRGVLVSIGHTHATPEQIEAAVAAGATLSTHLGNGSHAVLPRHPNYIWSQLAEDALTASFIADGHHLAQAPLKAMLRGKGLERSFLVSDAVALAGMAPGHYEAAVGGKVELAANGRLSLAGTPFLAGAAMPLKDGVAHVANLFDLATAITLATVNPGRLVGGRGRIEVGAPADLIRFRWREGDPTLAVQEVLVQGLAP